MSVSMYQVNYEKLEYGNIDDKEYEFLLDFRSEDGTFYIDEELLDGEVEAYKENAKEGEIPQKLVDFLRQKIKEGGYGDLIITIS